MNEQAYSAHEVNSDNRMLAAAAHFLGLWGALIIWATQKDKSRFVRFQSVQAMAFDLGIGIVSSVFMSCLMAVAMALMMLSVSSTATAVEVGDMNMPALMSSSWMFAFCGMFGYSSLLWVIRLIAAVKTLQGKDFRYPWLGAQVEKFLKNS